MSDDFRVPPLSDSQIREIASRVRESYGLPRTRPVNVIRCLETEWVLALSGRKRLQYILCDDNELPESDGRTEVSEFVRVSLRRSVHNLAKFGDGRARMTLAHELAHAVLHSGLTLHRRVAASGATVLSKVRPSESAEHQAKVFAAAFLIQDDVAYELESPEAISLEFGVSLEAARLCFDRLRQLAERRAAGERAERVAEQFRQTADIGYKRNERVYSAEPCPACKAIRLIPIGAKFLCDSCGGISEQI